MTDYECKKIARYLYQFLKEEKQDSEDEWLTTKEAAKVLGYTEHTVRVKSNILPNNGKMGKEKRYSKKGLIQLIANQ